MPFCLRAPTLRRIGPAGVPLGDPASRPIPTVFTAVPFQEIIGFPWVFKGFPDVPTLQSLPRFMFRRVQFPLECPICSSQFPVLNLSFPWFPFPASGQVGSQPKLGNADGAGPWRQHVLDESA